MLATQSIEALARQKGRASLYDWIVYKRESEAKEKGKEKISGKARSYIRSPSVTDYQYYVKDTAVSPTVDRNGYSRP